MNVRSGALAVAGFACLALAVFRVATPQAAAPEPDSITPAVRAAMPVRIAIPSRKIDVGVVAGDSADGGWSVDAKHANFLLSSAHPGANGNTVIYGHNTKRVFGRLKTVRTGDRIGLSTDAGTTIEYAVVGVFVTEPGDMRFVRPENKSVLTVYTCSGFLDSMRFIVRAVPVGN